MIDLSGLKALIVEDEGGVALLIEDMLQELGCEIVASVAQFAKAAELAKTVQVDFAVLDVNLDGQPVFPVARLLHDRSIPCVFSTGYGAEGLPPEFNGYSVVSKPFNLVSLRLAIAAALPQRAFPR